MGAVRGRSLPNAMGHLGWFMHLTYAHSSGRRLYDAARYCMTNIPKNTDDKPNFHPADCCDCEACCEANATKMPSRMHATVPREWVYFAVDLIMQEMSMVHRDSVAAETQTTRMRMNGCRMLRRMTARRKGSDTIESFDFVNHSIWELAR